MAYTYDPPTGGVFVQPKDEVRFLLNDTSPAAPHSLQDEELAYLLVQANGNIYQAASRAASRMATSYTKTAAKSKRVGNLQLQTDATEAAAEYRQLAMDLADGMANGGAPLGPLYADAGCGPFDEGQFDNWGTHQHSDVFGHPFSEL